MYLSKIAISHFRNLESVSLDFHPQMNIFIGQNASGKTSLLEAIHYLALTRSFRAANNSQLIQHQTSAFQLYTELHSSAEVYPLGIERTAGGQQNIRLAGQNIHSASILAKALPLLLMNSDSFNLVSGGPLYRRQYLDWLLFHVEHRFFSVWQRWNKILKQRNSALKQKMDSAAVHSWDEAFVETSMELSQWRQHYFDQLVPKCQQILSKFLPDSNLFEFEFFQGWEEKHGLAKELETAYIKDRHLGYTSLGPQRANIIFSIGQRDISHVLSRGQLKVFVFALQLAIALVFSEATGTTPLFLLDDLAAEVDATNQQTIFSVLSEQKAQVFITAIDKGDIVNTPDVTTLKMFHVEQGRVG